MHYKTTLSLLLALFTFLTNANAQNTAPAMNKTTGAISRLKAYAMQNSPVGTSRTLDSAYYFYSGDNGWDALAGEWKCDSVHFLQFTSSGAYEHRSTIYQSIGNHIDERTFYWLAPVVFKPRFRTHYTYTSGKLTEVFTESWNSVNSNWQASTKLLQYYNTSGQLTDSLLLRPNGSGGWDSVSSMTYTYVPEGKKTVFSKLLFGNKFDTLYYITNNYNNGRLVESLFASGYKYTYSYDNSNYATKRIGEQWDNINSAWNLYEYDTFAYAANGNLVTEIKQKRQGRRDTLRTQYEYNSHNQLTHIKYEGFYNNAWHPLPDSTHKYFYYEETFPSSVTETKANSSEMTLYPVPAAKTLTIEIAQQQAAELVCSICTIDGKIIRQWNQPATNRQYKETISVAELPTGNYILKAGSNGTVLSKQFQVVR